MIDDRTVEQKSTVIENVTQVLLDAIGAPKESIQVGIHNVPKENRGITSTSAKVLGRLHLGCT